MPDCESSPAQPDSAPARSDIADLFSGLYQPPTTPPTTRQALAAEFPFPAEPDRSTPHRLHCTMAAVDMNGRLAAAAAVEHLRWRAGQHLTITGDRGTVVTIVRAFDGNMLRPNRSIHLPMTLRRHCRILPRERLLLAASRELDLLIVYPPHTLTAALHRYRPELWDRVS